MHIASPHVKTQRSPGLLLLLPRLLKLRRPRMTQIFERENLVMQKIVGGELRGEMHKMVFKSC